MAKRPHWGEAEPAFGAASVRCARSGALRRRRAPAPQLRRLGGLVIPVHERHGEATRPALWHKPIAEITRAELLDFLRDIQHRMADTAQRVRIRPAVPLAERLV
jgi:hypothetical protein